MSSILSGPAWAYGCLHCFYGVKNEHYTEPTGGVEMVLERLVAAERVGPDYFCDCRAGTALRNNMLAVRERFLAMHMRLGPHKDGTRRKDDVEIENVDIGAVILSAARVAMAQPHMQFVGKQPQQEEVTA